MTIKLNAQSIFRLLLGWILFLTLANILINFFKYSIFLESGFESNKYLNVLFKTFNLNTEGKNLPTYYSGVALLFSSFLLFLISKTIQKKGLEYYQWLGLALIFAYLSLDEILALHEHLVHLTQNFLGLSGMGTAYWIIPYSVAVLIIFLIYIKFIFSLPIKTRVLFIISGSIFITGAVGMEYFGQLHLEVHGKENIPYFVLYTIEEFLEMLGIIIFIYALLDYRSLSLEVNAES